MHLSPPYIVIMYLSKRLAQGADRCNRYSLDHCRSSYDKRSEYRFDAVFAVVPSVV